MNKLTRDVVKSVLKEMKNTHYTNPLEVTDAQAMGILMAQFFDWDGSQILQATYEGLEDSNYHKENETIDKLIKGQK